MARSSGVKASSRAWASARPRDPFAAPAHCGQSQPQRRVDQDLRAPDRAPVDSPQRQDGVAHRRGAEALGHQPVDQILHGVATDRRQAQMAELGQDLQRQRLLIAAKRRRLVGLARPGAHDPRLRGGQPLLGGLTEGGASRRPDHPAAKGGFGHPPARRGRRPAWQTSCVSGAHRALTTPGPGRRGDSRNRRPPGWRSDASGAPRPPRRGRVGFSGACHTSSSAGEESNPGRSAGDPTVLRGRGGRGGSGGVEPQNQR
jgi:hypothetical protein